MTGIETEKKDGRGGEDEVEVGDDEAEDGFRWGKVSTESQESKCGLQELSWV